MVAPSTRGQTSSQGVAEWYSDTLQVVTLNLGVANRKMGFLWENGQQHLCWWLTAKYITKPFIMVGHRLIVVPRVLGPCSVGCKVFCHSLTCTSAFFLDVIKYNASTISEWLVCVCVSVFSCHWLFTLYWEWGVQNLECGIHSCN